MQPAAVSVREPVVSHVPVEPSSPKRVSSGPAKEAEVEAEAKEDLPVPEQSTVFDDEDTVDFNSVKLIDVTTEVAPKLDMKTTTTTKDEDAVSECKGTTSCNEKDEDCVEYSTPGVKDMTIDERIALERKARERLLVRIEQAHAKYRWELLSLDVLAHSQEQREQREEAGC